jgi:hypothetical protein
MPPGADLTTGTTTGDTVRRASATVPSGEAGLEGRRAATQRGPGEESRTPGLLLPNLEMGLFRRVSFRVGSG